MKRDTIESLEREEKELEEKMLSAPVDGTAAKATTDAADPETATDTKPDTDASPAEHSELVAQDVQPVTDGQVENRTAGENWELRYKNLRNSRDEKLYEAKRQLSAALHSISVLQARVSELQAVQPKVDPLTGVFTDEDVENLGQGTVDALQKATRKATEAATASLEKQLKEQQELRKQDQRVLAERTKKEAYDIFLSRVESAVPNWETINYEKGFEEYLLQPDYDGTQRKAYFSQAEAQGNAALIIRYMKEYEGFKKAPMKKPDPLADKVTPTGDAGGVATVSEGKQETVSRAFIDKFYDDLTRGRYQGRYTEQKAIEAKIDKAMMEGRIVN